VRDDEEIDFDWHGDSPIEDVNPDNYSVRWAGFVRAPITSTFTFGVKCDDGVRIFINGERILDHNFKEDPGCNTNKSIFDFNGPMQGFNRDSNSVSKPVDMTVGMKYEIIIELFHSVHDKHEENSDSYIALKWTCDKIKEEVIPKQYLYKTDSAPPLKCSGFNAKDVELGILQDGDTAFKDSEFYIMQEIP
jgi:hypothetical protein